LGFALFLKTCLFPFEEEHVDIYIFPVSAVANLLSTPSKNRESKGNKRNSDEISLKPAFKKPKTDNISPSSLSTNSNSILANIKKLIPPPSITTSPQKNSPIQAKASKKDVPSTSTDSKISNNLKANHIDFFQTLEGLKKGGWFTDEVVNSYFSHLSTKYPNVGFFSSYFMVSKNAQLWTKTQTISKAFLAGKLERIIFPYHVPGHWTLISISHDGVYHLLDSLGKEHPEPVALTEWLNKNFPGKSWRCNLPFVFPLQNDSIHCGAFICLFAELLSQKQTFDWIEKRCCSQNIQDFRIYLLNQLQKNHGNQNNQDSSIVDSKMMNAILPHKEMNPQIPKLQNDGKNETSSP